MFIDASELGDILVLSKAPFLQALSEQYDGDVSGIGNDTMGQPITFSFAVTYENHTVEPPNPYPVDYPQFYSLGEYLWDSVKILLKYPRIEENSCGLIEEFKATEYIQL